MRRLLEPNPPEIEQLFAAERHLTPAPEHVLDSAVERARAAIPRNPHARLPGRAAVLPRSRIGLSAAAAALLFSVCAAAFLAGYRIKTEEPAAPRSIKPQAPAPQAPAPSLPAPSSAGPSEAQPTPSHPRAEKVKPAATRRAATNSEAEVTELQLLRPAQKGVSKGDFASSLAAIADHQRRFPSGQLAEEREALRVKALLGLQRLAEARTAGAAFRERFPHSALLERIDEMLETRR